MNQNHLRVPRYLRLLLRLICATQLAKTRRVVQRGLSHARSGVNHRAGFFSPCCGVSPFVPRPPPPKAHHKLPSLQHRTQSRGSTTAATSRILELLPYRASAPLAPSPPPLSLCCKPQEQRAELRNPPNSVIRAATRRSSHRTRHLHCFPPWFF